MCADNNQHGFFLLVNGVLYGFMCFMGWIRDQSSCFPLMSLCAWFRFPNSLLQFRYVFHLFLSHTIFDTIIQHRILCYSIHVFQLCRTVYTYHPAWNLLVSFAFCCLLLVPIWVSRINMIFFFFPLKANLPSKFALSLRVFTP